MEKGDFIKINYTGRLESGEVFDLTDEEMAKKENVYSPKIRYRPITVVVGANFVIPGLDKQLAEMKVGEKKTVDISPNDAFGERNAELVRTVPQKAFKDQKVEPRQGMIVDFGGMKGRIQSASGGRVMVDFNNPLAGKGLKYDVEIVAKIDDPQEQAKGVMEFFGIIDPKARIEGSEIVITNMLPFELKKRIGEILLANMKDIEKVTFQESFTKKEPKVE